MTPKELLYVFQALKEAMEHKEDNVDKWSAQLAEPEYNYSIEKETLQRWCREEQAAADAIRKFLGLQTEITW